MATFFNTLVLLGILQGFIVIGLLLFSKTNKLPNRILAALIAVIVLASINLYGSYADWFGSPWLRFLAQLMPLVMPMAIGPLLYFYVQSVLSPEFKIAKKQKRHFYFLLIDFVPSLTAFLYILLLIAKQVKNNPDPWGNFIDTYNVYADIPRWMSVSIYVWLSSKYLQAYKTKHNAALNGQAINFKWLQQVIKVFMVFQAIWFVYLVPYVIPKYSNWVVDTFDWYPIYIPMAAIVYWLGIKGYILQANGVSKKQSIASNSLSGEIINQTKEVLTATMETDKLFLNPELNLSILSQYTGIPQKTISAVLNQHLQKSFNEFINGYRVQAFKEKICQADMQQLTIAGVAAECGFNSQATFQRTFKDITGMPPSAYLKSTAKNS
ncbi:MAG: AraC family transcriptional regulator [Chitinophagaceae bacterium]|nr:AraC family transcriptional regulator [Chitinophagaceae bacterium]